MTSLSDLLKPGRTAVVTGASSGIGRAASLFFAGKGMDVWMVDIDERELGRAHEMVQSKTTSGQVHAVVVDVSDASAMHALAQKAFANNKTCHVLMNNAGVQMGAGAMTDLTTFHQVMDVNTFGPIHGCQSFVPKMKDLNEPGIVINTGSKQGITMPPGNLVYNMSKAALKCYTEGLEHELMKERCESDGKLRAVLLVPGWVNTSVMLKGERQKAQEKGESFNPNNVFFHEDKPHSGAWMPEQVIDFMVQEIDKGSFYVICPDNDVDRETDKLRMTWTMGDITENRPPLSRWHPEYTDEFQAFVDERKSKM